MQRERVRVITESSGNLSYHDAMLQPARDLQERRADRTGQADIWNSTACRRSRGRTGIGRSSSGLLSGCRGVVAVETALILVPFFVIILGIMETARFLSVQQTLTDAAREGARAAVTPYSGTSVLPDNAAVEARVRFFLHSNGLQGAKVNIDRNVAPELGGNDVYTQVSTRLAYNLFSVSWFDFFEVTLSGTSKMRNETSP